MNKKRIFKVGDVVRPRTYEECIAAGYEPDEAGNFPYLPCYYNVRMYTEVKGPFTIKEVYYDHDDEDDLYNGILYFEERAGGFKWHTEMLEHVWITTPSGNRLPNLV